MTELETYIKSYFGITENDLSAVVKMFETTTLKKGDFFCKQDGSCEHLSFIREGILRIYAVTPDKEVTQWISTKGQFVTDLSGIVFRQPARRSIQALTDCTLYTINAESYRSIGKVAPDWNALERLFIAKCFLTMEDRIFSQLSMTAEERYDLLFENQRELFHQVPLQYLASMLGMTPETFSRIRNKKIS